jgi:hypothetical protein
LLLVVRRADNQTYDYNQAEKNHFVTSKGVFRYTKVWTSQYSPVLSRGTCNNCLSPLMLGPSFSIFSPEPKSPSRKWIGANIKQLLLMYRYKICLAKGRDVECMWKQTRKNRNTENGR